MFFLKLISIVAALYFIWVLGPLGPRAASRVTPWVTLRAPKAAVAGYPPIAAATTYLALGDSYTVGESVDAADRYPAQVVSLLNKADHLPCQDPDIIAVTGWTTGDLLEALAREKPAPPYRVVSLLIGVNNQFQGRAQSEYREQFALLLEESIALAGSRPSNVIVLSIPDYSVTPFGRSRDTAFIAAQIDSFNVINHDLALAYKVNYIDVTAESRKAAGDPTLIAGDGLHFSGKEYGRWARMMEPVLKGILQKID